MLVAHQLPLLRRAFEFSLDPVGVLVGGGVIMAIGMLDDRYELDALTKFAGQTLSAGTIVLFGIQWVLVWVPWGGTSGSLVSLDMNQGGLLTVALALVLINAMNFVDGLDGLAAGIGVIASVATCTFSMHLLSQSGNDVVNYAPALIAVTLAGACIGFLPHNFQPARIFMGDSGSMLIGLTLAAASTSAAGKTLPSENGPTNTLALLSPLIVVAAVLFVPTLDLLMAVIRRTRRGLSPFHADKMHLHHRLLEIGHSQRRAVLLIYLWAAVLAFGAVSLSLFDGLVVGWVMAVGLLIALVVSAVPRLRSR
jgi:UDP-GlcNAc:undecaprenyl-phosphate GlcNAc-1-phosphate transferase